MADIYLCDVVVEKVGELERFCTEEAAYAIPIMDEDNMPVDGIALCQKHSDRFDEGHSMMTRSRMGQYILIQLNTEVESDILEASDSTPPVMETVAPAPN